MKATFTSITFFLLILVSCGKANPNEQIDEGDLKGATYISKEIGWRIEIPKGWKIISRDKVEEADEKGRIAIEESSGLKIDIKGLKHLISFQKDRFNFFASTSEPFKEAFPGEYQQQNKVIREVLFNTFRDQGIKVDSTSGVETIEGLEFNKFCTTIYAPDGKAVLQQILYSRLINGYDFGVTINYNNEKDRETMVRAFFKSKFKSK